MAKEDKPYQKELDDAWQDFENNKLEQSFGKAEKIIINYPDAVGALFLQAQISFTQNHFKDALKYFELCLEKDVEKKNYGLIYYWIARIYDYFGFESDNDIRDTSKAKLFYDKALSYDNYPADTFIRLLRDNENTANLEYLNRGIDEFPKFVSLYVRLFYNSRINDNKYVLDTLEKGYSETKSYTIGFLIGKFFEHNKKHKKAIHSFNKYLKGVTNQADKADFYFSIGANQFKLKEIDNAVTSFERALDLKDGNKGHIDLIYCYLVSNQYDLAVKHIEKINFEDFFFDLPLVDDFTLMENDFQIDLLNFIDYKIFEGLLTDLSKKTEKELTLKVNLVLVLILNHLEKYREKLRILRKCVNEDTQDFILDNLRYAYSEYLESQLENDRSIEMLFKNLKTDISNNYSFEQNFKDSSSVNGIIRNLFSEKEYHKVVELSEFFSTDELLKKNFLFELAFSYAEIKREDLAQKFYLLNIQTEPNSSSSYNNVSIIFEHNNDSKSALTYISKAKELEPDKDLYIRNFKRIKEKFDQQKHQQSKYEASVKALGNETDFAISKLKFFIENVKSHPEYLNESLPISSWMFPKLIGANKEMSLSLKKQWVNRGYIIELEERADNKVVQYSVNPILEKKIEELEFSKVDNKWVEGITSITTEGLLEIEYPSNILIISKVNKKYKKFILRDYKELTVNYLMKNEKATLILAGSLTEYLLTYYCEKKKIKKVEYSIENGGKKSKKLYDCVLGDLINYFEENQILGPEFHHLNNLSRIYRNYVHPGKELRGSEELNMNKAKICFIGVSELLKKII